MYSLEEQVSQTSRFSQGGALSKPPSRRDVLPHVSNFCGCAVATALCRHSTFRCCSGRRQSAAATATQDGDRASRLQQFRTATERRCYNSPGRRQSAAATGTQDCDGAPLLQQPRAATERRGYSNPGRRHSAAATATQGDDRAPRLQQLRTATERRDYSSSKRPSLQQKLMRDG